MIEQTKNMRRSRILLRHSLLAHFATISFHVNYFHVLTFMCHSLPLSFIPYLFLSLFVCICLSVCLSLSYSLSFPFTLFSLSLPYSLSLCPLFSLSLFLPDYPTMSKTHIENWWTRTSVTSEYRMLCPYNWFVVAFWPKIILYDSLLSFVLLSFYHCLYVFSSDLFFHHRTSHILKRKGEPNMEMKRYIRRKIFESLTLWLFHDPQPGQSPSTSH